MVVDQRFSTNTAEAEIHIVDAHAMHVVIADVTEKFESKAKQIRSGKLESRSLQHQLEVT